jgi:hypothetical protein
MKDVSKRGAIVLDAFAGSGTTILAAEQVGRRAYCIEIDPLYADVCVRRWQKYTGRDAVLEINGETFGELQDERNRPAAVGDGAALPSVTSPNLAAAAAAPKRSSRRASKSSKRNTTRRARRR